MKGVVITFKIEEVMKRYILVLIASLMAATNSYAQSMTPQEERDFYQKAYALMVEYAQTAAVNNASKAQRFKDLFEGTDVQIYNDLMSLSNKAELSVDEYVTLLNGASTVSVTVKNIRKGQVTDQGDSWQMPLFFEKSVSYVNSCGTYIDSHEYFGCDFSLKAIIVVDKATERCFIRRLTNDSDTRMDFPEDYTVLVKSDARDDKLTIDGRIVTFNPYDQVLLHPGYKIKYLGSDVGEEPVEGESCDRKINVNYYDKNFRVKFHTSFALGGFYSLSDAPKDLTSSSSDVNLGLDFGYVFPSTGKLAVGVFAGVGYSSSKLSLGLDKTYSFSKEYESDIDGDTYNRCYDNVSDIKQTLKAGSLTVPVYVDFEYRLAPVISAYADLGIKLQANMSSTWDADGAATIGEVYGIYPQYHDLRLPAEGQALDINGFGTNKPVNQVGADDFKMGMGLGGMLGLGIRANIGKSLAAEVGIQYQLGLTNCWKNDGTQFNIDDNTNSAPLIQYVNNQEQMQHLLNTTTAMKQSALRLHIGIMYKF